ncbi:MAG: trehalose-6-phosphate synthase [Thermoleophilaceae bacterium]
MDGTPYRIRLVESDPDAYDGFYNVVANPLLWFIQHYLWDLSNAPDFRQPRARRLRAGLPGGERGPGPRGARGDRGLRGGRGHAPRLPPLHGAEGHSRRPAGRLPPPLRAHPVDAARRLAGAPERHPPRDLRGVLANDILAFHTTSYRDNFLHCCRELLDGVEVEFEAGVVHVDDREVWVRAYPLPISAASFRRTAQRPRVHEYEREVLRRRREHLIVRVDRADLSKNVLRGFTAFDLFLEQHPEFLEEVTFTAQLVPSRQDVPEYAEYLERIEALVAVINHRHGTTDWMPIDLKLRENLEEAIASYKHYDLLIVNAMFDGMNLIAKEGPLVNERHGVSLLSENTGAHEELGEFALSVNPFDIQEQADAIHHALTMSAEERSRRAEGLKSIVTARNPGDWVDDQLADIERKRRKRERVA